MKKLIISSSTVGEEYITSLAAVLKIRSERRKIYGDSWISSPIDYDIWMCYGKVDRMIQQLTAKKNNYENLEDCAIDLCNYCLFLLHKVKNKKNVKH